MIAETDGVFTIETKFMHYDIILLYNEPHEIFLDFDINFVCLIGVMSGAKVKGACLHPIQRRVLMEAM